ncbi:nuclear transport factor 2 family protein [Planotetraspora sp. A-T 1434]|uniref:nuclear transport factor 2 family protein n=1 Tax=Planotetraspora sp. A-T 1434 TaxID=2979219 RepID=UPI0021BE4559|nr:nuclear transport factor 2 family protein [Planotetraspora sp. A-T 1434]MCT9934829.1 nuclear transport factor 2 family protein [Planotetraspora sp. A-T 1434]
MSEHPNATIARSTYDALAKNDLDYVRDNLLADDVVFHVPGRGPLAGDYSGKDEVIAYLGRLGQIVTGAVQFEPASFLADDDQVAALLRIHGERDGKVLDERGVHVFRIVDGKITERWSFPQDSYVIDDFFA